MRNAAHRQAPVVYSHRHRSLAGSSLFPWQGAWPDLHPTVFLAPGCRVVGRVALGEGASVWFNAVVRGDLNDIAVGPGSNIQDNATLHVGRGEGRLTLGRDVVVGHNAVLHACDVGDGALIGMGAVVLDGASVGAGAVVAAGAVVGPGCAVPPGALAAGVPARVVRPLDPAEIEATAASARHYRTLAETMLAEIDFSK